MASNTLSLLITPWSERGKRKQWHRDKLRNAFTITSCNTDRSTVTFHFSLIDYVVPKLRSHRSEYYPSACWWAPGVFCHWTSTPWSGTAANPWGLPRPLDATLLASPTKDCPAATSSLVNLGARQIRLSHALKCPFISSEASVWHTVWMQDIHTLIWASRSARTVHSVSLTVLKSSYHFFKQAISSSNCIYLC